MNTQHNELINKIQTLIDKAYNILESSKVSMATHNAAQISKTLMTWELNSRTRTQCGSVKYIKGFCNKPIKMSFNENLFYKMTDEEQYETVSHELAHVIDICMRGFSDHKWHWEMLHKIMGGSGNRCHNMSVIRNKVKRLQVLEIATGKIYNNVTMSRFTRCNKAQPGRLQIINQTIIDRNTFNIAS